MAQVILQREKLSMSIGCNQNRTNFLLQNLLDMTNFIGISLVPLSLVPLKVCPILLFPSVLQNYFISLFYYFL